MIERLADTPDPEGTTSEEDAAAQELARTLASQGRFTRFTDALVDVAIKEGKDRGDIEPEDEHVDSESEDRPAES